MTKFLVFVIWVLLTTRQWNVSRQGDCVADVRNTYASVVVWSKIIDMLKLKSSRQKWALYFMTTDVNKKGLRGVLFMSGKNYHTNVSLNFSRNISIPTGHIMKSCHNERRILDFVHFCIAKKFQECARFSFFMVWMRIHELPAADNYNESNLEIMWLCAVWFPDVIITGLKIDENSKPLSIVWLCPPITLSTLCTKACSSKEAKWSITAPRRQRCQRKDTWIWRAKNGLNHKMPAAFEEPLDVGYVITQPERPFVSAFHWDKKTALKDAKLAREPITLCFCGLLIAW